MNRRALIFAVLVAVCVAVSVGWVAASALSPQDVDGEGGGHVESNRDHTILFQHISSDPADNARVAVTQRASPRRRRVTNLRCERVSFAADRGLCLMPRHGIGWTYRAKVFDSNFRVLDTISLPGINSRARVSPDGRLGAVTGFVSGHSYSDDAFSTATFILDLERGRKIANLEDFAIEHEGQTVTARDRNFWGVTFARDSNRFYATMKTGGATYLIEASVRNRTGRTLRSGVECPSLSPDETRIAFKRRAENGGWKLYVLDLETLREHATAEAQPFDDQPEWLDDEHVLYGLGPSTWVVPADGSGRPRMFLENALSPAVVR